MVSSEVAEKFVDLSVSGTTDLLFDIYCNTPMEVTVRSVKGEIGLAQTVTFDPSSFSAGADYTAEFSLASGGIQINGTGANFKNGITADTGDQTPYTTSAILRVFWSKNKSLVGGSYTERFIITVSGDQFLDGGT